MQQVPREKNVNTTGAGNVGGGSDPGKKRRKLPSPTELVSYYEKQGMAHEQASLKVIQDLQNALLKTMISSSGRRRNAPPGSSGAGPGLPSDSNSKLDVLNARLLQLDMKLDTKPGFSQTFAIGLASGVALKTFTTAAVQVWAAVRRATNSNSDFH